MGMTKDLYTDDMTMVENIILETLAKNCWLEDTLKRLYETSERNIELIMNDDEVYDEVYDNVYAFFNPSLPINDDIEYLYIAELINVLITTDKDCLDKALSVLDERFDMVV